MLEDFTDPNDICTHLGDDYDRYLGAIVPPLFQNSLFTRKNSMHGYSYSRINNPTIELLERKMAALEHGEAACMFSSGMAAITATVMSLLNNGDHAVVLRSTYHPTCSFFSTVLSRYGIDVDFIELGRAEEWEAAIRPNTKVFFLESPTSNIFRIVDLPAVAAVAKSHGIITVLDNTWATPIFQNPLDHGIDCVVHSASKYLGGHSDIIAGVAVGSLEQMDRIRYTERSYWGSSPDPFAAWLLIRSLRTLEVRMQRHSSNAMAVARYLASSDRVRRVLYPGLPTHEGYAIGQQQMRGSSGLLSFVLDADEPTSMRFAKNLAVFQEGPSWGGFESVLNTPGLYGNPEILDFTCVPKGLIRASVGLESEDSLLSAFEEGLRGL